jgi:hypothetical protein
LYGHERVDTDLDNSVLASVDIFMVDDVYRSLSASYNWYDLNVSTFLSVNYDVDFLSYIGYLHEVSFMCKAFLPKDGVSYDLIYNNFLAVSAGVPAIDLRYIYPYYNLRSLNDFDVFGRASLIGHQDFIYGSSYLALYRSNLEIYSIYAWNRAVFNNFNYSFEINIYNFPNFSEDN